MKISSKFALIGIVVFVMYWLTFTFCYVRAYSPQNIQSDFIISNSGFKAHTLTFGLIGCSLPIFGILCIVIGAYIASREWLMNYLDDYGYLLWSMFIPLIAVNILGIIIMVASLLSVARKNVFEYLE